MKKLLFIIEIILAINVSGQDTSYYERLFNEADRDFTEYYVNNAKYQKAYWEIQGDSITILEGGDYDITFPIYDSRIPCIIRTGPYIGLGITKIPIVTELDEQDAFICGWMAGFIHGILQENEINGWREQMSKDSVLYFNLPK